MSAARFSRIPRFPSALSSLSLSCSFPRRPPSPPRLRHPSFPPPVSAPCPPPSSLAALRPCSCHPNDSCDWLAYVRGCMRVPASIDLGRPSRTVAFQIGIADRSVGLTLQHHERKPTSNYPNIDKHVHMTHSFGLCENQYAEKEMTMMAGGGHVRNSSWPPAEREH